MALTRHTYMKPRRSHMGRSRLRESGGGQFIPRHRLDRRHHPVDTFKGLMEANDEVVSLITRARESSCIVCGSTEELTNGHLFSRRYYATRFDVSEDGNCHVQCWGCNKAHQRNKDPYTFAFVRLFGGEAHAKVRDRAFSGEKFTTLQLRELLDSNRALLRTMKKAA